MFQSILSGFASTTQPINELFVQQDTRSKNVGLLYMKVPLDDLLGCGNLTHMYNTIESKLRLHTETMYFIYDKNTHKKYIGQYKKYSTGRDAWLHLYEIEEIEGTNIKERTRVLKLPPAKPNTYLFWELDENDINAHMKLHKLNNDARFASSLALHKKNIPDGPSQNIFEYIEGPKTRGPFNIVDDEDDEDDENNNKKGGKGGNRHKRSIKQTKRKKVNKKGTKKHR